MANLFYYIQYKHFSYDFSTTNNECSECLISNLTISHCIKIAVEIASVNRP